MPDEDVQNIISVLNGIVTQVFPTAVLLEKYGGHVAEIVPGDPSSQIGGFFGHREHVSLEFKEGAFLADPSGVLEGRGKTRRHIKLYDVSDISAKTCETMLCTARDRFLANDPE